MTNADTDFFIEGERRLGRYMVVVINAETWMPSVMQLDTLITNFRIRMRPFRKRYEPATIPAHYIRAVDWAQNGQRTGIQVTLITDDVMYLSLGTGNLENLYDDLRAMKLPPPKFTFDDSVERENILRLIQFFKKAR